jgi:hypothetical protein
MRDDWYCTIPNDKWVAADCESLSLNRVAESISRSWIMRLAKKSSIHSSFYFDRTHFMWSHRDLDVAPVKFSSFSSEIHNILNACKF